MSGETGGLTDPKPTYRLVAAVPRCNVVCGCGWSASFGVRADAMDAFDAHDRLHREQGPSPEA
ncbi:MAG TPA: hypothetical protein VFU93_02625 [Acidimicrobiales bacterium]|nr:hypothetical protein [Acidimicrobiales bacterium]